MGNNDSEEAAGMIVATFDGTKPDNARRPPIRTVAAPRIARAIEALDSHAYSSPLARKGTHALFAPEAHSFLAVGLRFLRVSNCRFAVSSLSREFRVGSAL